MKGGQLCDTFTGFGVADPTMLERLERDVRKTRSDCNLGSVSRLFLSDVLLFEVEGRWCDERFWNRRASVSRPCFHRTSSMRWGEAPWVCGYPQIKKTVFLRFLEHLSAIRCYPNPVFWWRQKDGKIIWGGANPKASRCLDPDTKLKNTRGIIILQARSFLNGEAYFFLLRGAAFLSAPPATFLEPRPFFACRP